jgi:transforming growth factor-beta-induced protein
MLFLLIHRPNVCVTREEDVEENEKPNNENNTDIQSSFVHHFSLNVESCQETNTKHICKRITNQAGRKKTVTMTSGCCHGFKRARSGFCEKFELLSMAKIGEELNAKQFVDSAEKNDLQEMMKSNITVFMPPDSVFMEYSRNVADNNLEVAPLRNRRQSSEVTTKDLILGHIVDGFVNIEDVDNEQILTNKYNSTIRLNVFPKIRSNRRGDQEDSYPYLYTANCIPIVKANKFAENGIVHKVERVLTPINSNVMDIIRKREDMTILRTVLEKTKMDKLLDGTSEEDPETKSAAPKQFSIFAPTDSAFEKLDPQLKRKLKEGAACAESEWRFFKFNHKSDDEIVAFILISALASCHQVISLTMS